MPKGKVKRMEVVQDAQIIEQEMPQVENSELQVEVLTESKSQEEIEKEATMANIEKGISIAKELRVRIHGLIHVLTITGTPSIEKVNASNALSMTREWLRDASEYVGNAPLNGNRQLNSSIDIEEDTDKSDPIKVQVKKLDNETKAETTVDANEIQSINHVRLDTFYILNKINEIPFIVGTIYETFLFQYLREAKLFLDRELFRIKLEYKQSLLQPKQGSDLNRNMIITPNKGNSMPIFSNRKK